MASPAQAPSRTDGRRLATPLARAVAADLGIDLAAVTGSGRGGRIRRADVEALAAGTPVPVAVEPAAAPPVREPTAPAVSADVEEVPLSAMRRTVARRLVESMRSTPHFYLTITVDAEALLGFRAELNGQLQAGGEDLKVSVNDLIVKACAGLLRTNPELNVSWGGDKLLRHRRVHVGIAVALEGGWWCRWSATPTKRA
jgi:pyruvate dehydrogenase E2 component (dihydrolipoamide acetyltransferase)